MFPVKNINPTRQESLLQTPIFVTLAGTVTAATCSGRQDGPFLARKFGGKRQNEEINLVGIPIPDENPSLFSE